MLLFVPRIHLFEKWCACLFGMNGGFKSTYPPQGCPCPEQHLYSKVERRKGQLETGSRLPVLGTPTWTWPAWTNWAFAFSIWIWIFEDNMKEVCTFSFPVLKSYISFPWQECSSEAQPGTLRQCLLWASLLEGAERPSSLLPWLLLWTRTSAHPWLGSCAQLSCPLQHEALLSLPSWCQSRALFSVGSLNLLSILNDSDAEENPTFWASGKARFRR